MSVHSTKQVLHGVHIVRRSQSEISRSKVKLSEDDFKF